MYSLIILIGAFQAVLLSIMNNFTQSAE